MTMTAPSKIRVATKPIEAALALPLDHRIQRDGGADAGEGGDEVEERAQQDLGVGAGAEDVGRISQHRAIQEHGGDREDEGHQVQRRPRRARASSTRPSGLRWFHYLARSRSCRSPEVRSRVVGDALGRGGRLGRRDGRDLWRCGRLSRLRPQSVAQPGKADADRHGGEPRCIEASRERRRRDEAECEHGRRRA